jgi:hypothetical protein
MIALLEKRFKNMWTKKRTKRKKYFKKHPSRIQLGPSYSMHS